MNYLLIIALICSIGLIGSGCLLAVAGAGIKTGHYGSESERTTEELFGDPRITSSIKESLLLDTEVFGLDTNADGIGRHVTLKGMVDSLQEANEAISRLLSKSPTVQSVERI